MLIPYDVIFISDEKKTVFHLQGKTNQKLLLHLGSAVYPSLGLSTPLVHIADSFTSIMDSSSSDEEYINVKGEPNLDIRLLPVDEEKQEE